jgi:hypothetical protein
MIVNNFLVTKTCLKKKGFLDLQFLDKDYITNPENISINPIKRDP